MGIRYLANSIDADDCLRVSAGLGELDRGETETADTVFEEMTKAGRLRR